MRVLKNSVDTWKFPHLFKGGTKDGYAIFNWKALEEENFMWWKKRMRVMSWYLDIYSIREEDVCTKEEEPVYRKMIPQLVATSNMMGWGNGWESLRLLPVAKAEDKKQTPYLGAVYSSTPQSKTMRMWLGQQKKTISYTSEDKKQTFFDATQEECIAETGDILKKDSMFAMVSIQDWMSLDSKLRSRFPYSERINNPEEKDQVWKYRMHINAESLLGADSLNSLICRLVTDSGRAE